MKKILRVIGISLSLIWAVCFFVFGINDAFMHVMLLENSIIIMIISFIPHYLAPGRILLTSETRKSTDKKFRSFLKKHSDIIQQAYFVLGREDNACSLYYCIALNDDTFENRNTILNFIDGLHHEVAYRFRIQFGSAAQLNKLHNLETIQL